MSKTRFYNSANWKRLRALKLRANPICEMCLPDRITLATAVDHIKAINLGGSATALDNLQSLCHACHNRKTTYIERMGKARVPVKGCDANGKPLDPDHFWNKGK